MTKAYPVPKNKERCSRAAASSPCGKKLPRQVPCAWANRPFPDKRRTSGMRAMTCVDCPEQVAHVWSPVVPLSGNGADFRSGLWNDADKASLSTCVFSNVNLAPKWLCKRVTFNACMPSAAPPRTKFASLRWNVSISMVHPKQNHSQTFAQKRWPPSADASHAFPALRPALNPSKALACSSSYPTTPRRISADKLRNYACGP